MYLLEFSNLGQLKSLIMKLLCGLLIFISFQAYSQVNDTTATESGLKYYLTQKGNGQSLDSGTVVVQHYTVWLSSGKKLDSSRDRNQAFSFEYPTTNLIKGYIEALTLLNVGDRGIFIMPYHLAYGERGNAAVPPKETLTFDIEILATYETSLSKELNAIIYGESYEKDGIPNTEEALKKYKEWKRQDFKGIYNGESDLNTIGYGLLKEHPKAALEFFKLNVKAYPKSANVYDSLAEAYMELGENKLAIKNYEKSLKLNPDNENAKNMLKKLREI